MLYWNGLKLLRRPTECYCLELESYIPEGNDNLASGKVQEYGKIPRSPVKTVVSQIKVSFNLM